MKFVQITHPDVEKPAVVSERAAASYAKRGWQLDELVDGPTPVDEGPRALKRPQKNDSTASWRTYAVALGPENGGLSLTEAFDASRDELVAKYADPPKPPAPSPAPKKRAARKQVPAQPTPDPDTSTAPAKTTDTEEN